MSPLTRGELGGGLLSEAVGGSREIFVGTVCARQAGMGPLWSDKIGLQTLSGRGMCGTGGYRASSLAALPGPVFGTWPDSTHSESAKPTQ